MIKREEVLKVLNESVLGFWHGKIIDVKNGGFYGRINGMGQVDETANKSIILNVELLWTFSAAYSLTGNPKNKLIADRAYEYIIRHFIDTKYGGVYWVVDPKGGVVDDRKQVYAQAMTVYALTEYHKINSYRRAMDHAERIYNYIEKFAFDEQKGGYNEAFSRSWAKIEDPRFNKQEIMASRTFQTHLHLLEAYANLYGVLRNQTLRRQLENLVDLICTKFLSGDGHFHLYLDEQWKLVKPHYNYGYDMQGSWLLMEAVKSLRDESGVEKINHLSPKIVDAACEGFDENFGLMNAGDPSGVNDRNKYWWSQGEALVGLMNVWNITRDRTHKEKLEKLWSHIRSSFIDSEGEWHTKIMEDGSVDKKADKAGKLRGPYHHGRALIELIKRISNSNGSNHSY